MQSNMQSLQPMIGSTGDMEFASVLHLHHALSGLLVGFRVSPVVTYNGIVLCFYLCSMMQ